ncbi:MAG: hypothetical protein H6707_19375 [Deltaproteobacteria bacterium]|nr:hypothetical protein [Deltaproteobacteria bacterium]
MHHRTSDRWPRTLLFAFFLSAACGPLGSEPLSDPLLGKGEVQMHSLLLRVQGALLAALKQRLLAAEQRIERVDEIFEVASRKRDGQRYRRFVVIGNMASDGPATAYLCDLNGHWVQLLHTPYVNETAFIAYDHWLVTLRAVDDDRPGIGTKQIAVLYDLTIPFEILATRDTATMVPRHYVTQHMQSEGEPLALHRQRVDNHWVQREMPRSVIAHGSAAAIDIVGVDNSYGLHFRWSGGDEVLPIWPSNRWNDLAGASEELLASGLRLTNPIEYRLSATAKRGNWIKRNLGSTAYNLGKRLYDSWASPAAAASSASTLQKLDWPAVSGALGGPTDSRFGRLSQAGVWYQVGQTGMGVASLPSKQLVAFAWKPTDFRLGLSAGVGRPEPLMEESHVYGAGIPPIERILAGEIFAVFNAGWHDDFAAFYAGQSRAPHRALNSIANLATLSVDAEGNVDMGRSSDGRRWVWRSGANTTPSTRRLELLWQNRYLYLEGGKINPHYQDVAGATHFSALGLAKNPERVVYARAAASSEYEMAQLMKSLGCDYAMPLDMYDANLYFELLGPLREGGLPERFDFYGRALGSIEPLLKPTFYLSPRQDN